jgi:hypothetical protein
MQSLEVTTYIGKLVDEWVEAHSVSSADDVADKLSWIRC